MSPCRQASCPLDSCPVDSFATGARGLHCTSVRGTPRRLWLDSLGLCHASACGGGWGRGSRAFPPRATRKGPKAETSTVQQPSWLGRQVSTPPLLSPGALGLRLSWKRPWLGRREPLCSQREESCMTRNPEKEGSEAQRGGRRDLANTQGGSSRAG